MSDLLLKKSAQMYGLNELRIWQSTAVRPALVTRDGVQGPDRRRVASATLDDIRSPGAQLPLSAPRIATI
jgi:hypothetical protein